MNKYALIDRITKVRDGLTNAMGGTTGAHIAANSILTGTAAFTVAALARAITQLKHHDEDYADVDTTKYLDMSVEDPVIKGEHLKQLTGKTAAFKWSDTARWAAPAGAAIASAAIGHTMVDRMFDSEADNKLREDEAILEDLNNKISLARALNARGQLTDDAYNELMNQVQPYLDKKSSYMPKEATIPASENPLVMPALGLTMALAFALSAYGAYHYDAARNPNRLKHKAIKSGLKNYAMQNGGMYSVDRPMAGDASTRKLLESIDNKGKESSPVETPMTIAPVTI